MVVATVYPLMYSIPASVYDDLKRHRSDREHGALDNRWNGEGQIFFQRCRRTEDK